MSQPHREFGFCESLSVGDRVQVVNQDTVFRNDVATVTSICAETRTVHLDFVVFDRRTPMELDFDIGNQLLGPVSPEDETGN